MDSGLLKQFRQIFTRDRIKFDQKFLIFLFFLVISSIIWFLHRLGDDHISDINYPVRYTNFPKNKVLVGELTSKLRLKVKAHGYTLLKYKSIFKKKSPIIIDVNTSSLGKMYGNDPTNFYLVTRYVQDRISNQLSTEIQILEVSPDTLFFEFADIITKKVAVKPDIEYTFEKQFMLKGELKTDPDSVIIKGPQTIIDTIRFISTKSLKLTNLNETIERDLILEELNNITFDINIVNVIIPVEQFTEASLKVPIEVINLPDTLILKTFPGSLTISCMVGLSDYEKIQAHLFKAVVDYFSIENNISNKLKVDLVKFPDYISSIKFNPKNVEYIIEK